MPRSLSFAALALPLSIACGGPQNRADPIVAVIATASASASAAPPLETPVTKPSSPLSVASPNATLAIRIGLEKLRATPGFAALRPTLQEKLRDVLDFTRACGLSLVDVPRDVVVTQGPRGLVVAASLTVPPRRVIECALSADEGGHKLATPLRVANHEGANIQGVALVEHDGLLVAVSPDGDHDGDDAARELLEAALSPDADLAARLDLSGDVVAAGFVGDGRLVDLKGITKITGTLRVSPDLLAGEASFEISPDHGDDVKKFHRELEAMKRAMRGSLRHDSPEVRAALQVLEGVVYEGTGASRRVRVVLHADGRTQAMAIKALLSDDVGP